MPSEVGYYYTLHPGNAVRLCFQFNNYQYAGLKFFQARPLSQLDNLLICSDLGLEWRKPAPGLYVYSALFKNVGAVAAGFAIVAGDVS